MPRSPKTPRPAKVQEAPAVEPEVAEAATHPLGRARLYVTVPRDAIVRALPKGFWRNAIPRFKPINVCLLAYDTDRGDALQAARIARNLLSGKLPYRFTFQPEGDTWPEETLQGG